MPVICVDPIQNPLWSQLVQQYPGSVFHTVRWLQVLADTYQFTPQAYVQTTDDGQPVAGIPFVTIEDMRGSRIVSLPFSDFTDPLVADESQWAALIESLLESGTLVKMRCLHNDISLDDSRFETVSKAKWHGIDLTPSEDDLWANIKGSARRAVRKAEKDGVTIRHGNHDDLRKFFEMHLGIRKYKYQLLAQPYAFFDNIWQQFIAQGDGVLLMAEVDGQSIAATLFLEWMGTIYYKFNASHVDFLNYRPSDLIIWEAIRYAKAKGFSHFDFGLSDWDQEGLLNFKRKFATEEKTISFLVANDGDIPNPSAQSAGALLGKLTNLLTSADVPDTVSEQAGDLLYRYFV